MTSRIGLESTLMTAALALTVAIVTLSVSYHWPGQEAYLFAIPMAIAFIPIALVYPQAVVLILVALVPLDAFAFLLEDSKLLTITKLIFPFALGGLLLGRLLGKAETIGVSTLDKWILVWISLNVILVINAADIEVASTFVRRLISLGLLYYVASRVFIDAVWSTRLRKTLLVAAAVSVFFGLYGYISGNNPFIDNYSFSAVRITGAARVSPNSYAAILMLPAMLALAASFSTQSSYQRGKYYALLVLLLVGIALTFSRASYLALGLTLMLAPVVWRRYTVARQWWPLVILLLISLLFLPVDFWQRIGTLNFLSENTVEDYSLSRRFNYLLVGTNIFKSFPLLGAGPGNFSVLHQMSEYQTWSSLIGVARLPHNTYLQSITETGLIGFSMFIAILVSAFLAVKTMLHEHAMRWYAGALMLTLCAYLILCMFGNIFMDKYFWLLLAMIRSLPKLSEDVRETHSTGL